MNFKWLIYSEIPRYAYDKKGAHNYRGKYVLKFAPSQFTKKIDKNLAVELSSKPPTSFLNLFSSVYSIKLKPGWKICLEMKRASAFVIPRQFQNGNYL